MYSQNLKCYHTNFPPISRERTTFPTNEDTMLYLLEACSRSILSKNNQKQIENKPVIIQLFYESKRKHIHFFFKEAPELYDKILNKSVGSSLLFPSLFFDMQKPVPHLLDLQEFFLLQIICQH